MIRDNDATKTPRERIRAIAENLDSVGGAAGEFEKALVNECRVSQKQAHQLAKLATGREEKALAKLPKIKARFDQLADKKTILGGYVFNALKNELTPQQKGLPLE